MTACYELAFGQSKYVWHNICKTHNLSIQVTIDEHEFLIDVLDRGDKVCKRLGVQEFLKQYPMKELGQ